MRAMILSGADRYSDPWHPFPRTSKLIAQTLVDAGIETTIREDTDSALASLDGVELLVVNTGDPWRDRPERLPADAPGRAGLRIALGRGIGVLAMHTAIASLRDYPEWATATGAIWIPGASGHPPLGPTIIRGGELPDGARIEDFAVSDERYGGLQFVGHSHVVAHHEGSAGLEPTAWVRDLGPSRIAVDLLGHDERSYESAGHRTLLLELASWAAAPHQ